MDITREDVLRCAKLAALSLRPEEVEPLRLDMERMLSHAQSLDALDLDGVEPTTHGLELALVRRPDEPRDCFTQAEALANAPEADQGHFVVPKVL
jgi:aspartyl-tRNA(Asn)/glutamyl-tRNA(Gln) amidotransferase subunit C